MNQNIARYLPIISVAELQPQDRRLLMGEDGKVGVYYAPFDYLNRGAKVVLVGITPGPTQARNALLEAHKRLKEGSSIESALREAKRFGAFSGDQFRVNLVHQLDDWGVHTWLGISSTSELFEGSESLVQSTSLLRYPVFVDGRKYEGTPNMLKQPLLRHHLREYFVTEVHELKDALFIGLGPKVWGVLDALVQEGAIDQRQVFNGVFHGSGENTYRVNYAVGPRTAPLPWATSVVAYDRGKAAFHARFLHR
jgi:hypothetical protein